MLRPSLPCFSWVWHNKVHMSLISKLFEKRKIKDTSELDPDERAQIERWQAILSTGEMSVDKIKEFCENQVKLIENQWKGFDNSERKNERLVAHHVVYKSILSFITGDGTKAEREALERYLTDLIAKA